MITGLDNMIASLCAFNVRDDKLLKAFSALSGEGVSDAFSAYADICGILLRSGKSLSQYLHDMLIYSESPLVAGCKDDPDMLRRKAVEYDVSVIKKLSGYSSDSVKDRLALRYGNEDFRLLPDYETGEFSYDADHFIDFALKYGSGIYARYKAFSFADGELHPIESTDPIRLGDLKKYEVQRGQVVENTVCFLNHMPAQNVLLYGDRGTGKSSTIKALLNEYDGLRMVEVSKNEISGLPVLFRLLKNNPLRFIVTIDDLTFSESDDRFGVLKAALEGSLAVRPENVLIYATTNRRKIIKENTAEHLGDDVGRTDAVDESMSLADRFGLYITFTSPDKEVYLDIVKQLSMDMGIELSDDKLFLAAERFALRRGGRSPRTARQCVEWLYARISLGMDI